MAITQTVEIPANRRITIDVPLEVPTGRVILTFSPMVEPAEAVSRGSPQDTNSIEFVDASADEVMAAGDEILNNHIAAFKALSK